MVERKYLNTSEIQEAFCDYLIHKQNCTENEANMCTYDFPDPYDNCYLMEQYLEVVEINNEDWEMNASWTDFSQFNTFSDDVEPFRFYTYYKCADIESKTVWSYKNASKLYSVNNIDIEDFK